jgi:PAS domain-containing protein
MEFFSREIRAPDATVVYALQHRQPDRVVRRSAAGAGELDRFFISVSRHARRGRFRRLLQRVNPAWERALGYTKRTAVRPYMDFVHTRGSSAHHGRSPETEREGEELLYFENRYFHKDGTLRW